jgi:hypothetical protein
MPIRLIKLGWQPSVTFEQGLEKTVNWYLENQTWLNNITGEYATYYENTQINSNLSKISLMDATNKILYKKKSFAIIGACMKKCIVH